MVFMDDSQRAADLAKEAGIDVGLHLNLTQPFSGEVTVRSLREYHDRIAHFLNLNKYAPLLYHPGLRKEFRYVYQVQVEEFVRLYGGPPSHIDGHHHQHLCSNMLVDGVIPEGEKVRRSFHFWPGEKSLINRGYRQLVDLLLARRYRLTDFFFALSHCFSSDRMTRLAALAQTRTVEVMVHPANSSDYALLMSGEYLRSLDTLDKGTYSML